jgi:hypothetical protein
MDQRSVCLCLNRKGLSAQVIHDELVQVRGADAIAYFTMASYLRQSLWMAKNEERHSDRLQMLPTTQFSNPLIKSHSHRCANWQNLLAFQLQQFGGA